MKFDNTKNKEDKKTTDNPDKAENGGAGDQAQNGLKITDFLKKSIEASGPLKTVGTALHTGLNLPTGGLETAV